MNTGKALGGPCEGAKLSAPADWDGKVRRKREGGTGSSIVHHPGQYMWDADAGVWRWEAVVEQAPPRWTQRCPTCREWKREQEYRPNHWGRSGMSCGACTREYERNRRQARRLDAASI